MTTREDAKGDPPAEPSRVKRPETGRAPHRASPAAASVEAEPPGSPQSEPATGQTVNDAVAHAVKLGYDVIAENIRQGREAAARFRQGEYNIREAPGDLEIATQRLLSLGRELSKTTFDICERLLKELPTQKPPEDRARGLPPFREPAPVKAAPAKAAGAPPADDGAMKVTVRFDGAPRAIAHTASLARPRQPTAPADVAAEPLGTTEPGVAPISGVSFEIDVSVAGIIARVSVPEGQAPGVYSGLVRAKGDPIPLGVLTIELPK